MAAGKRQQLGNKVVEPRGVLWQQHRAALEQVDLRNEALRLVPFGFVIDDVDVFFAQGLDQTSRTWSERVIFPLPSSPNARSVLRQLALPVPP
jgi:hypothetical protein